MRRWGRWVFVRLLSIGLGIAFGALVEYEMGDALQRKATEHWAYGTTLVAAAGVWYLISRKHWDRGGFPKATASTL